MPSRWLILVIALVVLGPSSCAQTFDVLPEIDAYYRFNPNIRISFQAKDTREAGEQNSADDRRIPTELFSGILTPL